MPMCVLCPAVARADDEDEARRTALDLTQQAAVEYLTDREFKFEGELEGTARAVDPEKYVKVKIKDFLFVPGRVTVTFTIDARFEFEGTLEVKDERLEASGIADIEHEVDLTADYWFENGQLRINSRVTDAKFDVDVLELEPADLPGGKESAAKAAEMALDRQKDEIIRELNEWLEEQNRP
jgi:hypothetical protein